MSRKDNWEEFMNSNNWWSFCIVPLTYHCALLAVAYGEAEVKIIEDEGWPKDLFFRWTIPYEERKYDYPEIYDGYTINEEDYPTLKSK